jgi:uroporphyrinogen decarboxylase
MATNSCVTQGLKRLILVNGKSGKRGDNMLALDRMAAIGRGELPDRVPFVPVIYEHAAALIGVTPSQMAKSADLIVQGQLKAYEIYRHDLVTVGIDIYNIEAEAIGCSVKYFEDDAIPAVDGHVLADKDTFSQLALPDPASSGRMPLLLDAAVRVKDKLGHEVPVTVAVIGPFTLAALLRGFEPFVFDMVMDPAFVEKLLDYSCEVCLAYGKAAIDQGLGMSLNDSWITPPLLSPKYYEQFVLPRHQKLITALKAAGARSVSLISGGNTTLIADRLVQTGSSLLMADYGTDLAVYKAKAAQAGITLRGSIQARLLENGTDQEIENQAHHVLAIGAPGGRFVLGCGVVPLGAQPDKLLFLKKITESYTY